MPEGATPQRGPGIVEPVGYAVTQFVASIALVAGFGLAPDGLLLAAAAILLSVIDLRRFRAANPGVIPDDAEGFDKPRGKVLLRFSIQQMAVVVGLSALAAWSVHHDQAQAGALGPALVSGVVTLWINWRLKRALIRISVTEALAKELAHAEHDAEVREIDDRE